MDLARGTDSSVHVLVSACSVPSDVGGVSRKTLCNCTRKKITFEIPPK